MKQYMAHFIATERGAGVVKTLCGQVFEATRGMGWEQEGQQRGAGQVTSAACGSCAALHDAVIEIQTGHKAETLRPKTLREKGILTTQTPPPSFSLLEQAVDNARS